MTRAHSTLRVVALATIACVGAAQLVSTQVQPAARLWPPRLSGPAPGELQILPVRGNVHVIIGAGSNVTVQTGPSGVLVVDTGAAAMSQKVLAASRSISPGPIRYIVNTTEFDDYVGGNAPIADAGEIVPFREANYTAGPQGALDITKASVISYYTLFQRLVGPTGQTPKIPEVGWPDNTFSIEQKRLYFNDEPVVILHRVANTDANSIVLFRRSDVISTGGLLDLTSYPVIDPGNGGGINQMVDALNSLIDLAVPARNAEGGTLVVPGRGRIADHAEVVIYRDMMSVIRDRVDAMVKGKMTLAQVKAARPTRDYDNRYGKAAGPWTTDMFVEAVYRSLSKS